MTLQKISPKHRSLKEILCLRDSTLINGKQNKKEINTTN